MAFREDSIDEWTLDVHSEQPEQWTASVQRWAGDMHSALALGFMLQESMGGWVAGGLWLNRNISS